MNPSNNTSSFQRETNGSATRTSSQCFVNDSDTVKALRVAGYSVLILVSLLGNSLVVAVVYRYKKMRKTTNIFIANMAVADLIITIVYMPRLIVMYLIGTMWIGETLGLILCKIVPFLHGVSLLVSILTLLLISTERLRIVKCPQKHVSISTRTIIAIVWLVAVLVRMPYFLALRLAVYSRSGQTVCGSRVNDFFSKPEARVIYYATLLVVFYALPLVLIIVSYSIVVSYWRNPRVPTSRLTSQKSVDIRIKASKNVIRMMIVVTVVFVACWITYFVAMLVFNTVPCALRFWRLFLAHSNSALNPCLYVFFNKDFRRGLVDITSCIFGANKKENCLRNRKGAAEDKTAEPRGNRRKTRKQKDTDFKLEMMDISANAMQNPGAATSP